MNAEVPPWACRSRRAFEIESSREGELRAAWLQFKAEKRAAGAQPASNQCDQ